MKPSPKPHHTIFIRSYQGDLGWLQHCLRSIQKFVTGYTEVVVVVPADQKPAFDQANMPVKVCGIWSNDYLGQQITKIHADTYCQPGLITFVDSDCMFNGPMDLKELVDQTWRPIALKTPYSKMSGQDQCWKEPTERALGMAVEFEFMRRLPITYKSEHLAQFRQWFLGQGDCISIEQYVLTKVQGREFSEFNAVGAWLHAFKHDEYKWLDTEKEELPKTVVDQHWSWGGMTPEIVAKAESLLKD